MNDQQIEDGLARAAALAGEEQRRADYCGSPGGSGDGRGRHHAKRLPAQAERPAADLEDGGPGRPAVQRRLLEGIRNGQVGES